MNYIKDEGPMPEDECQGILNIKLHDKINDLRAKLKIAESALTQIEWQNSPEFGEDGLLNGQRTATRALEKIRSKP